MIHVKVHATLQLWLIKLHYITKNPYWKLKFLFVPRAALFLLINMLLQHEETLVLYMTERDREEKRKLMGEWWNYRQKLDKAKSRREVGSHVPKESNIQFWHSIFSALLIMKFTVFFPIIIKFCCMLYIASKDTTTHGVNFMLHTSS